MLVDSLFLSRLMYALPARGPLQLKSQTSRQQQAHNWRTYIPPIIDQTM